MNVVESAVLDGEQSTFGNHAGLVEGNEHSGISLAWTGKPTAWQIEAQGGPQLMRGQAVAIYAPGGGWLAYGNQTFGIDLVFSNTAAYQWYIVGGTPGSPIGAGNFGLWNSASGKYLIWEYQTFGVNLDWFTPTPPSSTAPSTSTASVTLKADPQDQGYVPFVGSFGGGVHGTLTQVSNPSNGPTLFFLKSGSTNDDCGDPTKVVTLGPGNTMPAQDMQKIWGSSSPSLAQPLLFVACAQTQLSSVTVNVMFRTG